MILLAVNFHYVSRAERPDARGIFSTSVAQLVAQVETLARQFELVSRDQLVDAVHGRRALPEEACLVTFDDGLREQFELALPALERIGAPALFLVPGRPLAEGVTLFVHKVHHVREALDEVEFASRVERHLGELGHVVGPVDAEEARAAYRYDAPDVARLKYVLNHMLPERVRERVVDLIFDELVEDERVFTRDLYMSGQQVHELERTHRAVGAHSYAHRPLARLGRNGARVDLERNADVLERTTGVRPVALSYPHGSLAAVSQDVAAAARDAGFAVGFTMERALNRSLEQPLLLARVDTNDGPGGKRPLFELDGPEPRLLAGMTSSRTRYLDENRLSFRGRG